MRASSLRGLADVTDVTHSFVDFPALAPRAGNAALAATGAHPPRCPHCAPSLLARLRSPLLSSLAAVLHTLDAALVASLLDDVLARAGIGDEGEKDERKGPCPHCVGVGRAAAAAAAAAAVPGRRAFPSARPPPSGASAARRAAELAAATVARSSESSEGEDDELRESIVISVLLSASEVAPGETERALT
jgi:hypothetical protein